MEQAPEGRLADFLHRRIGWERAPMWHAHSAPLRPRGFDLRPLTPAPRPTAEQLAREFVDDAEFQSLRLTNFINTPQGVFFAQAIETVMPPFYREDAELLLDALKVAAKLQQRNQRLAGGLAFGALIACGIAVFDASRNTNSA